MNIKIGKLPVGTYRRIEGKGVSSLSRITRSITYKESIEPFKRLQRRGAGRPASEAYELYDGTSRTGARNNVYEVFGMALLVLDV